MSTLSIATALVARGPARKLLSMSKLDQFFAGISSRMEPAQTNSARNSSPPKAAQPELEHFFASVNHRVEQAETQQRYIDKRRATGFNVFHLIEPDENKLSDILAGLLDPKGDHGQGDVFIRLLFKQLGLVSSAKLTKNAKVLRESPTHGIQKYRCRMDVFVEAGALVAIENKVDALDQKDQVKRYLERLRYCTRGHGKESILIYLTPNGRRPKSLDRAAFDKATEGGDLRCWSYQAELREWLAVCRQKCSAPKIKDFLYDFIAYSESHLQREPETNDEEETDEN